MNRYLALKASAGSGKTFALTVRYIALLFSGANPNEILCLTFTNKAANEMKQRIMGTLLDLEHKEAYLDELMKTLKMPKREILRLKNSIVSDFLGGQIHILTIDKFINNILREFSGFAGIGDDYKIASLNLDYFIYKFLLSLDEKSFENFVEFIYTHGKSIDSLVDIFRFLDEKNEDFTPQSVDHQQYLLLQNMILQNAFLLKKSLLANEGLSESAKKALDFDDFDSLMEKGKTWLIKENLVEYSYFKKFVDFKTEDIFQTMRGLYGEFLALDSQKKLTHIFVLYKIFKAFKQNYTTLKSAFEFSDVTNRVYALLSEKIDKEFLYFRLDTKFNHLLIDEFQDTSLIQYKILAPLIEEVASGDSYEYKSLFFVGDTKQAIYRFRNGKKELFDTVCQTYPNIVVGQLPTNYRSAANLVGFVNTLFEPLSNYEYFAQNADSRIGGYIKVSSSSDDWLEELYKEILHLVSCGVNPSAITVLTFMNDEIFEISDYFKQYHQDIAIATETTNLLINQPSVKAIIALIKYFYFKDPLFLANFYALIAKKNEDELSQMVADFTDLATFTWDIASRYGLCDGNMHLFIEHLREYRDIVDFIYEIDLSEAVGINAKSDGVNVMTIFKSKGLEFDNVVLLDRFKAKSNFSQPILFDYEGINLLGIYYKTKNLEYFDEKYSASLQKEEQLQQNDMLNILYVALTRAKYNMVILKKEKSSVFDALGLEALEIGKIYVNTKDEKKQTINTHEVPYFVVPKQKIKSLKEDILDIHSEYFGIVTHYVLQNISTFDEASLNLVVDRARMKYYSHLESEAFLQIAQRVKALLMDAVFQELIQKAKTIAREQPLMYKGEVKIVDLYLDMGDFGVVVDYKTGSVRDEYFAQVATYKKALKSILNKPILGFILYLWDEPKFFEV